MSFVSSFKIAKGIVKTDSYCIFLNFLTSESKSCLFQVHNFNCPVRNKETRSITLPNKTGPIWNLTPVIEGEYFSGPEHITVEPGNVMSQVYFLQM